MLIILISFFDYFRINREIIFSSNHPIYNQIVKSAKVVNNYFDDENDKLVAFLLKELKEKEKFRIIDKTRSLNRFAAFGIENVSGYHADLHINDYSKISTIFWYILFCTI